jgi:phosphoribosylformylglycinamidine cyclo-ligase
MGQNGEFTYKDAGVDVEAGNAAVELLKKRLRSTRHPLVLGSLGGFGGAMRMPRLNDPVLVAGTDGVGTKIELARRMGRLGTIGIDLVAMSVNDVSACGAVPLFFLDYLVVGKLVPEEVAEIVAGVDEGCLRAQCVLLGGETAEHPGQFEGGDFDMAGFAVGIAERDELWGPQLVAEGDALIGIDSSGLHSNGFSLIRRLLAAHEISLEAPFETSGRRDIDEIATQPGAGESATGSRHTAPSIGDVLLTPTAIYSPVLHDLGHAGGVHAAAHITGGGFPDNIGRTMPDGLAAEIDLASWRPPAVFTWLHALGVSRDELLRTFNCGLGMVLAVGPEAAARLLDVVGRGGLRARLVGAVVTRGDGPAVRYRGALPL